MRNFIVGTDWSSDCDDVMALRIFCKAHLAKKVTLLGVCLDDKTPLSVASLDGFLQTERCPVPIGFDASAHPYKRMTYQYSLAELSSKTNKDGEDAVSFYRRLLAESSEPVEIAEIGYEQVLAKLLLSKADKYSPLSGYDLVKSKVRKLWLMAGKWDDGKGLEHNLSGNCHAKWGGHTVSKIWPTPITFLGWEVGSTVLCGKVLPKTDVVGKAIFDYQKKKEFAGREGWDPLLALLAVVGDEEKAGYSFVQGQAKVSLFSGRNTFSAGMGQHRYVVKTKPDVFYADAVDAVLLNGF